MSGVNFFGRLQDSVKLKREQEVEQALWDVLSMHFRFFTLKNKIEEMPRYEAAFHEVELMGMEVFIRSRVNMYPEIVKKSAILMKYWG